MAGDLKTMVKEIPPIEAWRGDEAFPLDLRRTRLHHFFEKSYETDPKRVAVIDEQSHYSYQELERRANQLAHYLRRQNIGPGDRVGILIENSLRTYVALLGVLKAGAAFVPLDPSFPEERITFIAEDANLSAILTTVPQAARLSGLSCPLWGWEQLDGMLAACPTTRPVTDGDDSGDDELCYIIYTSGTTGRPKGVAISQRNICNFLPAANSVYGVTASDRVYQGTTIAFDLSVEEIWLSFMVGACLIVRPSDDHRYGEDLGRFLREQQVSVLDCVPTLLTTMDCEVPSLRLLIVGGEVCPQDLVARWSRPGRRILNTYGPTETTVTATCAELSPDRPVTIGSPLPGYRVTILDEALKPAAPGTVGEIHIGGPGVALGYINRADLTRERFLSAPLAQLAVDDGRWYRTGDLGRFTEDGEIEFCGRCDTQVKIRGYRIELAEIESLLREVPGVENVVASVWQPNGSIQELVAYFKPRRLDHPPQIRSLQERLYQRLPSYMVPAYLEMVSEIPLLPSGKVDRASLPSPRGPRLVMHHAAFAPPEGPLEAFIAKTWAGIFKQREISVKDDFFQDLGGHSLFAARAVSVLRRDPRMEHLSIGDLYAHPTVRRLAHYVDTQNLTQQKGRATACDEQTARPCVTRAGSGWWAGCATIQAIVLYLLLAVLSPEILVPVHYWSRLENACGLVWASTLILMASFGLTLVMSLFLPIFTKWLILGRCKPGTYPLWGSYFCRWWIVRKVQTLAPLQFMAGSPLMPIYFRLMGARIGCRSFLGTPHLEVPDLINIGEGTSIGYGTRVCGYRIEGQALYLERVCIGSGCYVGNNSVLLPGAVMADEARLGDLSLLSEDQTIPARESWRGSPARPAEHRDEVVEALAARSVLPPPPSRRFVVLAGHVLAFLFVFLVPAAATLPGIVLLAEAGEILPGWWFAVFTPVAGALFVICLCLGVTLLKRLLLPNVQAGFFPLHGNFYLRKWFSDALVSMTLLLTQSLYATLYVVPWLRSLGAAVGRRAEVSTVAHITPDMLRIEDESFVADAACIGPACVFKGFLALAPTRVGRRSFLGNSALVPSRSSLPDECLVGVLSVPPSQPVKPGTFWVGSPAFFLPRRQPSEYFGEELTYNPSPSLVLQRLGIEFFRVILPPSLQFASGEALFQLAGRMGSHKSFLLMLFLFPLLYFGISLSATSAVILLKRILIGTYRPLVRPLWSNFVRRTELVTGVYENVAVPMLLNLLTGTPFMAPLLRAFGARIGRRTYLDTTNLTEFDLVSVGDEASIGTFASLQTHLFEDRVMKMSHVTVGEGCSIGTRAVVLYDSVMEDRSSLAALSLLMKGETLQAGSRWQGVPARQWSP